MDGLIQQICSSPALASLTTQSAAWLVSLAEFKSWLRTRNIDFILQIVSIMNDLPGDRPDCEVCPDPCLVTCDNGPMLSCYRPPGCTMAPVKDHSTLTLGAIHSEINRKIIYPLMADHTNQFHSNNEMFPNMRLWCEFEWEAPDPWSGDWGTAPSPRLPCEGCVANVSLIYTGHQEQVHQLSKQLGWCH